MILNDEERMGKIQTVVEKTKKWLTHEICSGRSGKTRKLYDIQRKIKSHNSRNGQHRVVRVGTDDQNCPVLFMLETLAGRSDRLCLWRLPSIWWRNNNKDQSQIPSLARVNCSRGKKHGETQWQQDHWKAVDARRGALKHNKDTIVIRWQEDEKYRNSQQAHEMDRRILPILGLPHDDRHLLHSTVASEAPVREHHLVGVPRWGSSSWTNESKKRFETHSENSRKSLTRTRTTKFRHSEERENEAKTIRWSTASRNGMDESKLENLFHATFPLHHLQKIGSNTNIKTLNCANSKTPNGKITSGEITRCGKSESYSLFCKTDVAATLQDSCAIVDFFKEFRSQERANPLQATGGEDRTLRRTHILLGLFLCSALDSTLHTYMRACGSSQTRDMIWTCCILARLLKSHPISQHVSHNASRHAWPISSFCTPPQTTPDSLLTGIRRTPCATPLAGMLYGHLAESSISSHRSNVLDLQRDCGLLAL